MWGITPIPDNMVGKVKRNTQAGESLIDGYSKGFVTKLNNEASMIRNHYDTLSNIVSSFGLQASKPTVTPPVTVEALPENAKLQDANIKPTEDAEVLQEVDVVLPLVQQPVNLFEREDEHGLMIY